MIKKILLPLLALALFTSCIKEGDVRLVEVGGFQMRGASAASVTLTVENLSNKKITLQSLRLSAGPSGSKVVDALLDEPVTISRRSTETVTLRFHLKVSDPLAAIALAANPKRFAVTARVWGDAQVKAGWLKRKISIPETPIGEFITKFAPDTTIL